MAIPDNGDRFISTRPTDSKLTAFKLTPPENSGDRFVTVLGDDGILIAKKVVLAEVISDRSFSALTTDGKLVLVKTADDDDIFTFRNIMVSANRIIFGQASNAVFATAVTNAQTAHDASTWENTNTTKDIFRRTTDSNNDPSDRNWQVRIGTHEFFSQWNAPGSPYNVTAEFDFYKTIWETGQVSGAFIRILLTGTNTNDSFHQFEKFDYNYQLYLESVPQNERAIDDGAEAITVLGSPTATGVGHAFGQAWKFDDTNIQAAGHVDFTIPASFFQGNSLGSGHYAWGVKAYVRIDRSDTFIETQPNATTPSEPLHTHEISPKAMFSQADPVPGNIQRAGNILFDDTFIFAGMYI